VPNEGEEVSSCIEKSGASRFSSGGEGSDWGCKLKGEKEEESAAEEQRLAESKLSWENQIH